MNLNSTLSPQAAAQEMAGSRLQHIATDPPRDIAQVRLAYLKRRFGLAPIRAALIAEIAYSTKEATR